MTVYQQAIRLLSTKNYSRHKLTQKLLKFEFKEDEIEEAIERLIEERLFQEKYYIDGRIKALIRKGYSKHYIQQKLALEEIQITSEELGDFYTEHKESDDLQLERVLQKKYKTSADKDKAFRYAISKGYSYNQIKNIWKQIELK